jgi:hypothetical protein
MARILCIGRRFYKNRAVVFVITLASTTCVIPAEAGIQDIVIGNRMDPGLRRGDDLATLFLDVHRATLASAELTALPTDTARERSGILQCRC